MDVPSLLRVHRGPNTLEVTRSSRPERDADVETCAFSVTSNEKTETPPRCVSFSVRARRDDDAQLKSGLHKTRRTDARDSVRTALQRELEQRRTVDVSAACKVYQTLRDADRECDEERCAR